MKLTGEVQSFENNWKSREEAQYVHWVKDEPRNQIQLAFRNHWTLFQELMADKRFNGGRRTLEVGCGRGSLSCYFSEAGYTCTLMDISPRVIDIAKGIFDSLAFNANFVVGNGELMRFKDNSFDIVFSIGLLEHFEDPQPALKEQVRVLDRGGLLIGYVVPKYTDNVQKDFHWINEILKGYHRQEGRAEIEKEDVYRSDAGSEVYVPILEACGLNGVEASGVYPLPMISHSVDFPFSLMPPESEAALVKHFSQVLDKRRQATGTHPWLCEEGYGQAFLVWGYKG